MVFMVTKAPAAPKMSTTEKAIPIVKESTPIGSKEKKSGEDGGSSSDTVLATGEKHEAIVTRLMEMGFSRPQVITALRAAFNNPDRAVEYLVSGIPSNLRGASSDAPTEQPPASELFGSSPQDLNFLEAAAESARRLQSLNDAGGLPLNNPESGEQLEAFINSPLFNRIRQIIASDPQMILPILRQLGKVNPKLFQYFTNNQDQLFRLLGEDTGSSSLDETAQNPQSGSQWSAENDPSVVYITNEDNAAIERLSALGFERSLAIEAFFACDKNEELAANYLFNLSQGL